MTKFLDRIDSPEDLRKIKRDDLDELALEIRNRLLEVISKTGGHLASNLGVVELTLALHYVFESPKDKFVWDVGLGQRGAALLSLIWVKFYKVNEKCPLINHTCQ